MTTRSEVMRAVKSTDTQPELEVRRLAHLMGYRFRLHRRDLPGSPDLVFPSRRKIIFVHGCFWHGHTCKRGARAPKTNAAYWRQKISRNKARDVSVQRALAALQWECLGVWECQTKDAGKLRGMLAEFLK